MNDIAKLKSLVSEVKDTDRPKFDRVYNEVLYPRMVNMAESLASFGIIFLILLFFKSFYGLFRFR